MLARTYLSLPALLLLCFVFICPAAADAKETIFQNPYYVFSWNDAGNIRVTDLAKKTILSSAQYQADYGTIYNAMTPTLPKGTNKITLDQPLMLQPGSDIEIRSESFGGRLNAPVIHRAKVTQVRGNDVFFSPPTTRIIDRNIFIKRGSLWVRKWDAVAVETKDSAAGCTVTITGQTPVATVSTQYELAKNSPAIQVTVKTTYKRDANVFREALALQFEQNVTEVYRKNRKVDTQKFQPAYWLDRQGVKFGQGRQSAFVYHTPNVSSLELNTAQKQLLVNLDHMNDHRYVQQTVSSQIGKVRHPSEYHAQNERQNSFTLVVGSQPKLMPRFMSQPFGYLATHVWTEHADEQNLQTNRAIYFGSEKITASEQATGGFVKYRIPVTKSVFFTNPYYKPQAPVNVAIQQSHDFLTFLDDLHRHGNEICLHTIYPYELRYYQRPTEDTFQYMKTRFQTKTWIDHGYLKANFGFNGLDRKSGNYLGDLWEKYGVSYFWQYSSEDIANVNDELDLYQSGRSDALRTPLYWSHPTVTGPFYTWADVVVPEDTMDQYKEQNLQKLIHDRGVLINHTYLARIPSNKKGGKYLIQDAKGSWVIHPDLNHLLKRMSELRDQGQLYLTTVRDIMDYWIAVSHVRIEYSPNGSVLLYNENKTKISGLSLAIRGSEVYVNGQKPAQKKHDGDLIFWFDLAPQSYAVIAANKADSLLPKVPGLPGTL